MLGRLSKKLGLDKAAHFLVHKHQKWSLVVACCLIIIILGYWFKWDWKGFIDGYNKVTIQKSGKETTITTELPQAKSLWDWLSVLCIPIAIAFGSLWFTAQQNKTQDAENEDNQRERALQEYIDKISDLLLQHNLRGSSLSVDSDLVIKKNWMSSNEEVRTIARARTLTVLTRLDSKRKGSVLQFLYESGLIQKENPIISLQGADLTKVHLAFVNLSSAWLSGADLSGADLSSANLSGANLGGANLGGANLSDANLIDANLWNANLGGADLSSADLGSANLWNADLGGANLTFADLGTADLNSANLGGANLGGANLGDANLWDANLSSANLSSANLIDANLSSANLSSANLSGADLATPKQLAQATSLEGTTMPDGSSTDKPGDPDSFASQVLALWKQQGRSP